MKDYLLKYRPKISTHVILILFVTNILTLVSVEFGNLLLLYPSNISEPWNWYRLFTYPLYVGGLKAWFLNSLAIILYGYIIENRMNRNELLGLIFISAVTGGILFTVFNRHDLLNIPVASPAMISWGYWSAAIIIGLKFWKFLNLFEKIVMIFGFLSILSFWNDNVGFLLAQLVVVFIIMILTLIRIKTVHNTAYKP